ncbi:MAG: hypothetical protein F6K30_01620 [Cyanothece sp. SIO2G6]|nr:hypothetical protein [Cyanothece sp. SIO2G6]
MTNSADINSADINSVDIKNTDISSVDSDSMDGALPDGLQASQIVCLEHAGQRLYMEVIQILRDRQSAWTRPLCLCAPAKLCTEVNEPSVIPLTFGDGDYYLYDMRQGSDLIWPLSQFRVALDTEAIPILSSLGPERHTLDEKNSNHITLRAFIHRVWHDAFSPGN